MKDDYGSQIQRRWREGKFLRNPLIDTQPFRIDWPVAFLWGGYLFCFMFAAVWFVFVVFE